MNNSLVVGDQQRVDDHDVFQAGHLRRHERQIADGGSCKPVVDQNRERHAGNGEHGRRSPCAARREGAGRDRASRLDRVPAIGVSIDDVVDEIDRARTQAERDERAERSKNRRRVGAGAAPPAMSTRCADYDREFN